MTIVPTISGCRVAARARLAAVEHRAMCSSGPAAGATDPHPAPAATNVPAHAGSP